MRICWIRLRSLGDCILTLPAIGFLKQTRPETQLTYVIHPQFLPLFSRHPWIDELIVIPRSRRAYLQVRKMKRNLPPFDCVINAHGGRLSLFLTRHLEAKKKIGFSRKPHHHAYTHAVTLHDDELYTIHTVDTHAKLLEPILGRVPSRKELPSIVWPNFELPPSLQDKLNRFRADRPLVVLHPSARFRTKRWEYERFFSLMTRIIKKWEGIAFAYFLGPQESHLLSSIDRFKDVFLLENLRLHHVIALFRQTSLFIGYDTGIMHLASSLQVPVIILWGPSYYPLWAPWRTRFIRLHNKVPCAPCHAKTCSNPVKFTCIDGISDEDVHTTLDTVLRGIVMGDVNNPDFWSWIQ